MGIPTDVWRARIGCFVQPGARAINSFIYRSSRHVSTNRYRRAKHDSDQGQGCDSVFTGTCTSSVVIKLLLVTLLLRAGVESNPGPGPTVPGDGAGSFTQCGVDDDNHHDVFNFSDSDMFSLPGTSSLPDPGHARPNTVYRHDFDYDTNLRHPENEQVRFPNYTCP